jgi:DNA-binding SARP family transcriptional activator
MSARMPPAATVPQLRLLGTFELRCDGSARQPALAVQRVVAYLALAGHPVQRPVVASALWPDAPERRALASLRSALWRLGGTGQRIVVGDAALAFAPQVRVDLRDAEALARGVLAGAAVDDWHLLENELLPGWYDDWVLLERERFRQLRLHALDALCDHLRLTGRRSEALAAGLAAVADEPLRESAHRAVIRVHLDDGNACEALRQYRFCRRLLREQLGARPTQQLERLVDGIAVTRP